MNPFSRQPAIRKITLVLIFVIGPLGIHWFLINPVLNSVSNFQSQVRLQASGSSSLATSPTPASDRELEQLEKIKADELVRYKKITDHESLLQFSGALADALASKARSYGLRVREADYQNASIKAKYIPGNDHALDALKAMPGVQWTELSSPLELPMMNLPSTEIQMIVAAEYSRVFSFIESLTDFPVPMSLESVGLVDDQVGKAFRLKIRAFYFGRPEMAQQAQLTAPDH